MFQLEHFERFYRNTVEISEISENHLKAIVDGRQMAGRVRLGARAWKVAEKTQGEGKAPTFLGSGTRWERVPIALTCGSSGSVRGTRPSQRTRRTGHPQRCWYQRRSKTWVPAMG